MLTAACQLLCVGSDVVAGPCKGIGRARGLAACVGVGSAELLRRTACPQGSEVMRSSSVHAPRYMLVDSSQLFGRIDGEAGYISAVQASTIP